MSASAGMLGGCGLKGGSEIAIICASGLCATSVGELSNAPVADAHARTVADMCCAAEHH